MDPVFISYRQIDETQRARVRAFADQLRNSGITVILDQFFVDSNPGGPPEGWPKWSSDQAIKTKRVLIIGSESWFHCFDGTQQPGTGLGAACEAGDIRQRIYDCASTNEDIRVVLLDSADNVHISTHLKRYHRFQATEDLEGIVRWLGGTVGSSLPTLPDWPDSAPTLHWPVADHTAALEAFARLITRGTPHRYLPISGISEMGKSHITNQFLANAHSISDLRCGRFDFKGSADMDRSLATFAEHLCVATPHAGTGVSAQLAEIFNSLKSTGRPTLLIFDTFELAIDSDRWVKETLLISLLRAPWLRVIIIGQKVPAGFGQPWSAVSAPEIVLRSPTPEEWFQFGQSHKPSITLDLVRQVHSLCGGKIPLLAGLLGPSS